MGLTMHFKRGLPLMLCLGLALPALALSPVEGVRLAAALDAAAAGDWERAQAEAAPVGDGTAAQIVQWARLREGIGDWAEYGEFLEKNPHWPSLPVLRRRAEMKMLPDLAPETVLAFFEAAPPQTGTGVLRLAAALVATGREAEADAAAVRGWREARFSPAEQTAMLVRYGTALEPHHEARLDALLWDGLMREAERMLDLVDEDWQALARARIAVRRDTDGSTALIRAVPPGLRGDPGLAYERYLYRIAKGRWEDAEEYLLAHSTSAAALGQPDQWMERRARLSREALQRGDTNAAYRLAAQNFGSSGGDFAEAEWLAGYIALTGFEDAALAEEHFVRFRNSVRTPISLGRAGYWLGLARDRVGDAAGAQAAWRRGAKHQTSFYGQLAAERAGISADQSLAAAIEPADLDAEDFPRRDLVRAAELLDLAGDDARVMQFLRAAAEGEPPGVRAALAQRARLLGRPHAGVRIAKDAAADGVVLPDQYYPLHAIAERDWPVPAEYALAVARQESEMNPAAESPAGALGLMQLMPGTAEDMARVAGVVHDPAKLTEDPLYNARLGTEYLARMLDRYSGSYLLATAAYNAGPSRVDQWIRAYGDPRKEAIDPVNWIETIPFSETRNYVMRVLEALHVYRAQIKGRAAPIRLVADMDRQG